MSNKDLDYIVRINSFFIDNKLQSVDQINKLLQLNEIIKRFNINNDESNKYLINSKDINFLIKFLNEANNYNLSQILIYIKQSINMMNNNTNNNFKEIKIINENYFFIIKNLLLLISLLYISNEDEEKNEYIYKLIEDILIYICIIFNAISANNNSDIDKDVIFIYKYLINLCIFNPKKLILTTKENETNNNNNIINNENDNSIYSFNLFNLTLKSFMNFINSNKNTNNNNINIDNVFKEISNFIISTVTDYTSKIKISQQNNLLSLINIYINNNNSTVNDNNNNNKEILINLISSFYLFSFNEKKLNVLLDKIKNSLTNLTLYTEDNDTSLESTNNKNNTIKYILKKDIINISNNCELLNAIKSKENLYIQRDKYFPNNSFIFTNCTNFNGIDIIKVGNELLNGKFTLIFSFNLLEMTSDKDYPIISFIHSDTSEILLKFSVKNNHMQIKAKKEVVIDYKIDANKTYLIIFEKDKKKNEKNNKFSVRINDYSSFFSCENEMKFSAKCNVNIGYYNNSYFIGYIGTVIFFKDIFDESFSKILYNFLFNLYGYYDYILLMKKPNDLSLIDKYLPYNTLFERKIINESYDFIKNNYSKIEDALFFNISPLAIIRQNSHCNINSFSTSDNDMHNNNYNVYKENIFNRTIKNELYKPIEFILKINNNSNNNNFNFATINNNNIISQMLKYEGINYLILLLEYLYNLLRNDYISNNIDIINDLYDQFVHYINNIITLYIDIIKYIKFTDYKNELESFGFSFAKTIRLFCDYFPFNYDIGNNIILLFKEIININKRYIKNNSGMINNDSFTYMIRFFYFLFEPSLYNINSSNYEFIGNIFTLLNECIQIFDALYNNKTLECILKFKFLFDKKEIYKFFNNKKNEMIINNNNNNDKQDSEISYKKMIKHYKKLIGNFILNAPNKKLLDDYITYTFEIDPNKNKFETYSLIVIYQLLKILYYNYSSNSFSQKSLSDLNLIVTTPIANNNNSIIASNINNSTNNINTSNNIDSNNNNNNSTNNNIRQSYLSKSLLPPSKININITDRLISYLNFYNKDMIGNETENNIPRDLIISILIVIIFEDINIFDFKYNNKKLNFQKQLDKLSSLKNFRINSLTYETKEKNEDNNNIINSNNKSFYASSPFTPKRINKKLDFDENFLAFPSSNNTIKNYDKIDPLNRITFIIFKALFTCLFDNTWDKKTKIKFIKLGAKIDNNEKINFENLLNEYNNKKKFNYICKEFNLFHKNLLNNLIELLTQINNNSSLQFEILKLLLNFLINTIDKYKEEEDEMSKNIMHNNNISNNNKTNTKCQFIHLFESRKLMKELFCLAIHLFNKNKNDPNSIFILKQITSIFKDLFEYHYHSFMFAFFNSTQFTEISPLLIEIMHHLNQLNITKYSINKNNKNNNIIHTDKISITYINQFRLISFLRKSKVLYPKKFSQLIIENNFEFCNVLEELLISLLQSIFIYDCHLYYQSNKLKKFKRFYNYKNIFLSIIELIFSIATIKKTKEVNDNKNIDNGKEIFLILYSEYINNILLKLFENKRSIFFSVDIFNEHFEYNSKDQIINEIENNESIKNFLEIQNDICAKNNGSFYYYQRIFENKLVSILLYIKLMLFFLDNFQDDIIIHFPIILPLLQKDIGELINLIEKPGKIKKETKEIIDNCYVDIKNNLIINIYDKVIAFLLKHKRAFRFTEVDNIIKTAYKSYKKHNKEDIEDMFINNNEINTTDNTSSNNNTDNINSINNISNAHNNIDLLSIYNNNNKLKERKDSFSICEKGCKDNSNNKNVNRDSSKNTDIISSTTSSSSITSNLSINNTNNNNNSINNSINSSAKMNNKRSVTCDNVVISPQKLNHYYSLYDFNIDDAVICTKRDLLLSKFGYYFHDCFFNNKRFILLGKLFKYTYDPSKPENCFYGKENEMNLCYPSTIKNYSFFDIYYPKMFLRPDLNFFKRHQFNIGHEYYNKYIYPSLNISSKNNANNTKSKQINNSIDYYKSLEKDKKILSILSEKYPDFPIRTVHSLLYSNDFNFFSTKYPIQNYTYTPFSKSIIKQQQISNKSDEIFECEIHYSGVASYGNILFTRHFICFQTRTDFSPLTEYKKDSNYTFATIEFDLEQRKKQVIILQRDINIFMVRKFAFLNVALEVFLHNGKSYYFNFMNEGNFNNVIKKIKHLFSSITLIEDSKKEFYNMNYMEKWTDNKMSTFDYILQINKFTNRSYNEINQYPVFPWIIRKYNSLVCEKEIRKFEYPISIQEYEKQEKAKYKYQLSNGKYPSHFQIHYSNSSFVNTYLLRLAPFTYNQIKFQNNMYDKPNRQLNSFKQFNDLLQEIYDNRELIPEMFCMFEFLLNLNFNFFGKKQDDTICNNISCDGIGTNSISFLINHRKTLEEFLVKKDLHKWIDNIFGCRQFIVDINSLNCFPKECYEQYMIKKYKKIKEKMMGKDKIECMDKIRAKTLQSISLGQTPSQLFTAGHPVYNNGNNNKNNIDNGYKIDEKSINDENMDNLINDKNISIMFNSINIQAKKKANFILKISNKKPLYINKTTKYNYIYVLFYDEIVRYKKTDFKSFEKIKITPIENFNNSYILNNEDSENLRSSILHYSNSNNNINLNNSIINNNSNNSCQVNFYKYKIFDLCDGEYYITCCNYENSLKLYNIKKGLIYNMITESQILCMRKSIRKSLFVTGHENGKIFLWNYSTIKSYEKSLEKTPEKSEMIIEDKNKKLINLTKSIIGHKTKVLAIEISDKHNFIISGGEDNIIIIRKLYNFEILNIINLNNNRNFIDESICDISLSFNNLIYATTYNKNVKKFSVYGYTFNPILFGSMLFETFLPLSFIRKSQEIFYIFNDKIWILDGTMTKKDNLINIKNEILKIENQNRYNDNNSFINWEHGQIVSYIYDSNDNNLYCLLSSGELLKIFLTFLNKE